MPTPLCHTFRELSAETWHTIQAAAATGMRWSEESNTEHLLLRLRLRHPTEVHVTAFSKKKEESNGADWEWWFVGPGSAYGMRVQAKRITLPGETFRTLYYKNQMERLIDTARADGLTPAYCFYVASEWTSWSGAWPGEEQAGCLIGHAEQVKSAQSNYLFDLRRMLMPWHFLVCPSTPKNAALSDWDEGIAHRAASAMRDTVDQGGGYFTEDFGFSAVLDSPSSYVSALMDSSQSAGGSPDRVRAGAFKHSIKGILVISENRVSERG